MHDIGVPAKASVVPLIGDPKSPMNMLQGSGGWCSDWPSGDAIWSRPPFQHGRPEGRRHRLGQA